MTAAAQLLLYLRLLCARGSYTSDTHTETSRVKLHIYFIFSIFSHEASPLENAFFVIKKPRNISPRTLGPRFSIDSNSSCSRCEKRTDLASHKTPCKPQDTRHPCSYSYRAGFLGDMHPASTLLSFELAALLIVVYVGRTRPARGFKFLLFAEKTKKNVPMYVSCVIATKPVGAMGVRGVRNMSHISTLRSPPQVVSMTAPEGRPTLPVYRLLVNAIPGI